MSMLNWFYTVGISVSMSCDGCLIDHISHVISSMHEGIVLCRGGFVPHTAVFFNELLKTIIGSVQLISRGLSETLARV